MRWGSWCSAACRRGSDLHRHAGWLEDSSSPLRHPHRRGALAAWELPVLRAVGRQRGEGDADRGRRRGLALRAAAARGAVLIARWARAAPPGLRWTARVRGGWAHVGRRARGAPVGWRAGRALPPHLADHRLQWCCRYSVARAGVLLARSRTLTRCSSSCCNGCVHGAQLVPTPGASGGAEAAFCCLRLLPLGDRIATDGWRFLTSTCSSRWVGDLRLGTWDARRAALDTGARRPRRRAERVSTGF